MFLFLCVRTLWSLARPAERDKIIVFFALACSDFDHSCNRIGRSLEHAWRIRTGKRRNVRILRMIPPSMFSQERERATVAKRWKIVDVRNIGEMHLHLDYRKNARERCLQNNVAIKSSLLCFVFFYLAQRTDLCNILLLHKSSRICKNKPETVTTINIEFCACRNCRITKEEP